MLGAADVDGNQLLAVVWVDRHHAGAVDTDGLGAIRHGEKLLAVVGIAEVALKNFDTGRNKFSGRVTFQHKGTHGIAALQQLCADVRAQESGRTGDKIKRFHIRILRFGCGLFRCTKGYRVKVNAR